MFAQPVLIDFSNEFSIPEKSSSSLPTRLEQWAPLRPNLGQIIHNLNSANERREEILLKKKFQGSQEIKAAKYKAENVKQIRSLETEKLANEIANKLSNALTRAEIFKKQLASKGSQMSVLKLDQVRKEEKLSLGLTREMNDKRHKEALERVEKQKQNISKKCAQMNVSKLNNVKKKNDASIQKMKINQRKRHQHALERANSTKRIRSLLGAVMSVPKIHIVKLQQEEKCQEMKCMQSHRENEALARAEIMKIKKALKGMITVTKVTQARAIHYYKLEKFLQERKKNQLQKEQAAEMRLNEINSKKIEKALKMSVNKQVNQSLNTPHSPTNQKKKIITLRKQLPNNQGAHVVTLVAPNDEQDKAELLASDIIKTNE